MIPPVIVQQAVSAGIQLLAITDHNHSANAAAVQKAALGFDLTVLPGMELQTAEDIHLLCLFDQLDQVGALQAQVDKTLPDIQNKPDTFGAQFIVDETGDFIRTEDRLLLNATSLSLQEGIDLVHTLGGLAIPAHVDRQAYGLLPALGFFPPDLGCDAVEVYKFNQPEQVTSLPSFPAGTPVIQNGDAHFPSDLLGACYYSLETPTIQEIRKSLWGEDGRSFRLIRRIDNPRRGL